MFTLQVLDRELYENQAASQHEFERSILPRRGEIYLTGATSNPLLVATNISKNLVFAVPREIEDTELVAKDLATILELEEQVIIDKIKSGSRSYVPLKKQLTDETSEKIKELGLPGIQLEPETIRLYPEKNLGSHVLGFLGYQGNKRAGQYGIEGKFEKKLAGTEGLMGSEKDVAGRWITLATRSLTPAQDGDDIYLTLDAAIQYKAQEVLKKTVAKHGAESGSVIVLNPKTGAVLALANYPDFDLNEYNKISDPGIYSNKSLSADYEPGSVFKPITMAAALNEGKVNPETTYEDTGSVTVDDRTIKNSDLKANGVQTMTQVLEKSLNTGMVFVESKLGHEAFRKYIKKFRFGSPLGIELPSEAKGDTDNLNRRGDIWYATGSFGQGITVTPLQLITAYTAIANEGKLMKPYVVDRIVHPDKTEEKTFPDELETVLDPKTAAKVSAMLVNVVESGHGQKAAVNGYYIAGKTGTAQVPYKDRSGYDPTKNIGSFVGFGPVDNPAFLMLVRIDHPKDVRFAESTAAPAFGEIASFILNYLQIPPSRQP